ncbi:hypothetical protein KOW79_011289 [Hemibagrus wyckioides]|uniref:AIG1-type G domain-containing protein n=1 Tax=Hemibagrus wyckioides TaxID=337641 RepID=A0A9D3NPI0_9TELE|nr:hypothetical protein KOW79_011289 [Hemibagrus wyckioides]
MLRSKMGSTSHSSGVRVLLTGYQFSGKSSTGNTILEQEAFVTFPKRRMSKCVKSEGVVQGRHVTVVDIPGLWRIHPVKYTTELCQQEMMLSVTQCPPGPHIVLVLVRLDISFTENSKRTIEGHFQLFGENVWRYTMVLFTCGDSLGETTIEQFIESEGEALQWLVKKCNNMYHVFNNNKKDDRSQVSELLEKIDEVVASNGGGHFEMDQMILQEVQEKRKMAEDKAKKRRLKAQEEKRGATGSESKKANKSAMHVAELERPQLETLLGKNSFSRQKTFQSEQQHGLVAGRQVVVVDTPGWDWDHNLEVTPELDWQIVESVHTHCSKDAPVVFLLVVRAAFPFKEVNKRITEEYLQLLGDSVWNHTIVLFTTGGWMEDIDIELHIESEGDALQWLVEKCGNRYHVLDTKGKKEDVQVPELMRMIEQVVANNKSCPFQLDKEICERFMMLQGSMHILQPSMDDDDCYYDDDDKSSGFGSAPCLQLGTSSTSLLSVGRTQQIHFNKSRTLGDLSDPDTSLKSITESAEDKKLKIKTLKYTLTGKGLEIASLTNTK